MFISIEGTDASGKSTLVEAIHSILSSSVAPGREIARFHKGKPESLTRRWVLEEYAVSIEREDWFDRLAVADRWHWGEVTYAPIKRPETCVDDFGLLGRTGWRWVELFMASRGIAQFWLYQPLDVIVRRITERGDDFVSAAELERIIELYKNAADSTLGVAARITPADSLDSVNEMAHVVIDIAKRVSDKARPLAKFPEYIGTVSPDVLLVGDKRNDPAGTILPFMPVNNNSGEYLLSSLPEELWRRVGIINSADIYGQRLFQLLDVLGKPRIVALGRLAERELRNSGLYDDMYTVVPHPQYVRRFHWNDRSEYGRAIQSFAEGRMEEYSGWVLQ